MDQAARSSTNGAAFYIVARSKGWHVQITWADGVEGPDVVFATKRDALDWIARDAPAWFERLSGLSDGDGPKSPRRGPPRRDAE
jgi:hypothetical protein